MKLDKLSLLIDEYNSFWSGWEFATQKDMPRLFTEVHEALQELHALKIETGRIEK